MLNSFKPSHSPKRMWLAVLVIVGIGAIGMFMMLAV